ncbi:MAG TPA: hypothetical protein VMT76_10825 [Puia sp.]|nr:hypothetical protein [Puia sp.]
MKNIWGDSGTKDGIANGVDACIKAVLERYKEGSDLIKIKASAGVLSLKKWRRSTIHRGGN